MMPLSPGDHIREDFEEDWQMENGDVYSITAVPGSEWLAANFSSGTVGEKGAPITFTQTVRDNALTLDVIAIDEIPDEEPPEDQYCSIGSTLSKKEQASGIRSVTITPAIDDSEARLGELFPLQYEEGADNNYKFRLSKTPDPVVASIEVKAWPIGEGWCTLTASDGTNKTSSYAGGTVQKAWNGASFPATITIKGSSDQAGTESVYTFIIKGPAD